MRPRLLGLIVVVALGLLAGTVLAQDAKPDYEKAKQHYTKALQALDMGDYAIAAREFGAAYQITKDPILFYKIALSHEKAGDCESALVYYGRYLKEASPPDKERTEAEGRVAGCKEQLGQTDSGDTGAAGTAGDAGGSGGDIIAPDIDDTPTGGGVKRQPTFIDEGAAWQRTAAWVSVGVAVAAGTTAAVLGLSASSREEDIDTLVNFRDPLDNEPRRFEGEVKRQYEEFVDEGKDLQTYSRIAWAAAGVGAAAAVVFFILDANAYEDEEPEAAAMRPRVTPVVTEDAVGVSAGWRF